MTDFAEAKKVVFTLICVATAWGRSLSIPRGSRHDLLFFLCASVSSVSSVQFSHTSTTHTSPALSPTVYPLFFITSPSLHHGDPKTVTYVSELDPA